MGRIYDDITQTIGHTPLVRLNRITEGCGATVLAKLEFFNPLSSVKDRVGLAMIEAAERAGDLKPETVLIEPTSGNTGIALAFVAAVKGLRLILTMPETMSIERRALLRGLGAELELTPAAEGMRGAVERAYAMAAELPNALILQQFDNPANPAVHARTTAEEIWDDTAGAVDAFVAGVGTGGSISGVGGALKARKPDLKVFAVEPATSAVIAGERPGPHQIQGIGAGFVPRNLDRGVIDACLKVTDEVAYDTARRLARLEGIPAGISSGATCAAALEVARRPELDGGTVVVIFASSAERYLSTPLYRDLVPGS
ncbi:MAG: cysteine synthase A [Myxococcales bacterium]|nr:cysteine synthase A [Myxococcales bacterium]